MFCLVIFMVEGSRLYLYKGQSVTREDLGAKVLRDFNAAKEQYGRRSISGSFTGGELALPEDYPLDVMNEVLMPECWEVVCADTYPVGEGFFRNSDPVHSYTFRPYSSDV